MELEFHQIELRYESLRRRDPRKERQILASLDGLGQVSPAVVLAQPSGRYILLDGYKRFRALKRLKRDTIWATLWEMDEAEALLLERLMRSSHSGSALEQGWLLRELRGRFGMTLEELGRRFDRTPGWVSRRLALVRDLPEALQEQVLAGRIAPDTAMKVLVPLSRVNVQDGLQFGVAIARAHLSTREVVALHAGWLKGDAQVRERILADPALFLRAREVGQVPHPAKSGLSLLFDDLGVLAAVARRALGRVRAGAMRSLLLNEGQEAGDAFRQARLDCQTLFTFSEKELADARPGHENRHPAA